MKILGITGGSGTGKTTVSRLFSEHGIYVIDADVVAREIVGVGMEALSEIEAEFGSEIINADGGLNRAGLAHIVFNDAEKLEILNRITHKYITAEIERRLAAHNGEWAAIDAAALIESGLDKRCDKVLAVVADFDVRKSRIIMRDKLGEKQAAERLNAQKDKDFYIKNADFVIENNADEYALRSAVNEVIRKLGLKE